MNLTIGLVYQKNITHITPFYHFKIFSYRMNLATFDSYTALPPPGLIRPLINI